MREISHLDIFHNEHTLLHFPARSCCGLDPICQSVCKRKCPSSIGKQQNTSERDMIWQQIWGMEDEREFKSCLSNVKSFGFTCTICSSIWLVAVQSTWPAHVSWIAEVNAVYKFEFLQAFRIDPVTCQNIDSTFGVPISECTRCLDALHQGTGSNQIKLGGCQLFACKSTFWGNNPSVEK